MASPPVDHGSARAIDMISSRQVVDRVFLASPYVAEVGSAVYACIEDSAYEFEVIYQDSRGLLSATQSRALPRQLHSAPPPLDLLQLRNHSALTAEPGPRSALRPGWRTRTWLALHDWHRDRYHHLLRIHIRRHSKLTSLHLREMELAMARTSVRAKTLSKPANSEPSGIDIYR